MKYFYYFLAFVMAVLVFLMYINAIQPLDNRQLSVLLGFVLINWMIQIGGKYGPKDI